MNLHVGCAAERWPGWLNADIRADVGADLVFDLSRPWPFRDGVANKVVICNVLERLPRGAGSYAISEAARILKPGGIFTIETFDLLEACLQFASGNVKRILDLYGSQKTAHDFHRWGYWPEQMQADLPRWGFEITKIGKADAYHDTDEPTLRVEARRGL